MQEATITTHQRIGAGVRYCRSLRSMKAQELADAIERSSAYLSRIESGTRPATAGDLMAFAHVLDVPLEWLRNPPLPPTVMVGPSGPSFGPGPRPTHNTDHADVVQLDDRREVAA